MVMIRDFAAQVKAVGKADGLDDGQFEAIVAVFGNVDTYGDRIVKGAFADDVARWKSGEPLPIVWSHKWDDPFAHIGFGLDAQETDKGLRVKGQIEDLDSNPTAAQVHRLLKSRRVTQFSFAYDVLDGGMVDEEVDTTGGEKVQRSVYELRKLKTFEVGPCLVGVNQETELIGAKAANLALATAAGRRLGGPSLKRLGQTIDALREVITLHGVKADDEPTPDVEEPAVDTEGADDGSVSDAQDEPSLNAEPHTDDDPSQGKSEEAAPRIARRAALVDTFFL